MGTRDDYKFLPLRDVATCVNQKVNLVAVVVEFGFPRQSKGTDYCCTLRLIDESEQNGMSVIFFTESPENLPHVAACGDVIELYRVQVRTHEGETNAVFNKSYSAFALYKGKDGESFIPYQVSSKFNQKNLSKKSIIEHRKWLVDFQLCEDSCKFPLLSSIKQGGSINLACKVLHYYEAAKDEWRVLVWDGTDVPPNSISAKLGNELQPEPLPSFRDLYCTFPTIGTVLRITFNQGVEENPLKNLSVGMWAKFVNIHLEVNAGLWCGVFTPFTKFRYTPEGDCLVLERQRLYNERKSLKQGRMPSWSFSSPSNIAEVDYPNAPFVNLMDLFTHNEVPAKFKCMVRVVAAFPWQIEESQPPLETSKLMQLTLEDATARIHALVVREDWDTLFGDFKGRDILTGKLSRLIGAAITEDGKIAEDAPRNPPWVPVCIKSYYVDKPGVYNIRFYRVFGTRISEEM